MPPKVFTKTYRPGQFVPSTSFTGSEEPLLFYGENMWIRFGRFGSVYAEGYTGSRDLGEVTPHQEISGTLDWTAGDRTIVGEAGVSQFTEEILPGMFILLDDGTPTGAARVTVEEVIDDESFTVCVAPQITAVNRTGYILPVIYPLGTKRGTSIAGNAIPFIQGHYIGVGRGEMYVNGAPLNSPFFLDRRPQIAIYDATTGTYTQDDVGISLPTPAPQISLAAFTPGALTTMRAGAFNIRVMAKSTKTLGYSNPTDAIAPVTIATGDQIAVTFLNAMVADQDAYDIYASPWVDNSLATVEARFQGPWYFVKTVHQDDLIDGGHPTGREAGTIHKFSFLDGEIVAINNLISFNNFQPGNSMFVDSVNGIPIYFSCLGKGNPAYKEGTAPGPSAIPSKPSNPESVFLNKAFSMAGHDTIVGEFQVKSRIFALGLNSLQVVILTTLESEPIAFRSLWNVGFRNPYACDAIKEYVYGMSTAGMVRSVAGGDETSVEFDFASDVKTYVDDYDCSQILVRYDPKNRAMIFFISGAYMDDNNHWVTVALPFMIDRGVFNPPIILSKDDGDFIVSGVATVGQELVFLAGGRVDGGVPEVRTYAFDGGESVLKRWSLCWMYTDDGEELTPKRIKGFAATGRFENTTFDTTVKVYGIDADGIFDYANLRTGDVPDYEGVIDTTSGNIKRVPFTTAESKPYSLYAIRMDGAYVGDTAETVDRVDELALKIELNASEQ